MKLDWTADCIDKNGDPERCSAKTDLGAVCVLFDEDDVRWFWVYDSSDLAVSVRSADLFGSYPRAIVDAEDFVERIERTAVAAEKSE